MSDWKCPDCGSVGTPYVVELDALRAELTAANTRIFNMDVQLRGWLAWAREYGNLPPETKAAIDANKVLEMTK